MIKTGESHLRSLRDGREVYLLGQRVEDVTVHRPFEMPLFPPPTFTISRVRCQLCLGEGPGVIAGGEDGIRMLARQ